MSSLPDAPLWIHILSNFGFPVAITIYLLIRFEKRIAYLENAILELTILIKNWRDR